MTPIRVLSMLACFVLLSLSALAQSEPFTIGMRDACDPGTFSSPVNAAGPGACKPGQHGTTKFKFFIAELQSDHIAGAWRFNPLLNTTAGTFQLATVSLNSGQTTALQNTGGELHTFTKVATFGGGFIPPLNQLSGNPVPALSACNQKTRQIYSLKPVLLMPDRQQARLNFRLALAIGNAVSTPGCG